MKRLAILLVLLSPVVLQAQAPDTCRVYTSVHRLNGRPAIGLEFTFAYVSDTVNLVADEAVAQATDSSGYLAIGLIRNSWVLVRANVDSLRSGQIIRVPDADSAELRLLYTTARPPGAYLAITPSIRIVHGSDSGTIERLVVSGSGAAVTITGPSATITVTGGTGDTSDVLHDRMAAIEDALGQFTAGTSDSLSAVGDTSRHANVTAATALGLAATALQSFTESDPIASPAAATAQDTASAGRLETAAHAARTDNPHAVSAAQVGALTAESDPLSIHSVAGDGDQQMFSATSGGEDILLRYLLASGGVNIYTRDEDKIVVGDSATLSVAEAARDTASNANANAATALGDIANLTNVFFPLDSMPEYWWVTDSASRGKVLETQFARSGGAGGVTADAVRDSVQAAMNGTSGYDLKIPSGGVAKIDSLRTGVIVVDSTAGVYASDSAYVQKIFEYRPYYGPNPFGGMAIGYTDFVIQPNALIGSTGSLTGLIVADSAQAVQILSVRVEMAGYLNWAGDYSGSATYGIGLTDGVWSVATIDATIGGRTGSVVVHTKGTAAQLEFVFADPNGNHTRCLVNMRVRYLLKATNASVTPVRIEGL